MVTENSSPPPSLIDLERKRGNIKFDEGVEKDLPYYRSFYENFGQKMPNRQQRDYIYRAEQEYKKMNPGKYINTDLDAFTKIFRDARMLASPGAINSSPGAINSSPGAINSSPGAINSSPGYTPEDVDNYLRRFMNK